MSVDPRCCGSGTCIIDPEGRCWCGQQWDGEKMSAPPLSPLEEPPRPAAPQSPKSPGQPLLALLAAATVLLGLTATVHIPAQATGLAIGSQVAAGEARAIRKVIEDQLAAFAVGNADAAFSFAARSIRLQFGTAENFMDMVQAGYPMVVRPTAITFFALQAVDGEFMQAVQLRDGAGRLWLAQYDMVKDSAEDRSNGTNNGTSTGTAWRIAGCRVRPAAEGLST
jgi:Domain of unknown function (DUF4864)